MIIRDPVNGFTLTVEYFFLPQLYLIGSVFRYTVSNGFVYFYILYDIFKKNQKRRKKLETI